MSSNQIREFVQEIFTTDTQVKRVLKGTTGTATTQLSVIQSIETVLLDSIRSITGFEVPVFSSESDLQNSLDIINAVWAPSILIAKIISQIPLFLQQVLNKQQDSLYLVHLGSFSLLDQYDLELLLNFNHVHVFFCKEDTSSEVTATQRDPKKLIDKYVVVTESSLLNFSIVNQNENIVALEKQLFLYAIDSIRILSESNNVQVLQISFTQIKDNKQEAQSLVLHIKEGQKLVDAIQKNYKRMNVKKSQTQLKGQSAQKAQKETAPIIDPKKAIMESDVTLSAYSSTDIQKISHNIAIYRSRLEDDLSIHNINTLMELYQKAIEFYSATNDDRFIDYMESLKEMLQRQDIQLILQSEQEHKKSQSKSGNFSNNKRQTDEDEYELEDEEEEEEEGDEYDEEEDEYEEEEEDEEEEDDDQEIENGFVDVPQKQMNQKRNEQDEEEEEEDSIFNDVQFQIPKNTSNKQDTSTSFDSQSTLISTTSTLSSGKQSTSTENQDANTTNGQEESREEQKVNTDLTELNVAEKQKQSLIHAAVENASPPTTEHNLIKVSDAPITVEQIPQLNQDNVTDVKSDKQFPIGEEEDDEQHTEENNPNKKNLQEQQSTSPTKASETESTAATGGSNATKKSTVKKPPGRVTKPSNSKK